MTPSGMYVRKYNHTYYINFSVLIVKTHSYSNYILLLSIVVFLQTYHLKFELKTFILDNKLYEAFVLFHSVCFYIIIYLS